MSEKMNNLLSEFIRMGEYDVAEALIFAQMRRDCSTPISDFTASNPATSNFDQLGYPRVGAPELKFLTS